VQVGQVKGKPYDLGKGGEIIFKLSIAEIECEDVNYTT